jgi:hypothetical protein
MRAGRVAAIAGALSLAALLTAASAGGASVVTGRPAADSLEPFIQPARRGPCIADPATMRRDHGDMLKHQRFETVHEGLRDGRASLKACIACHASVATDSVAAAPTDFCVSCHSYASVKVDCFECHASKPQATAFVPLNHPMAATAATRLALQWRQVASRGLEAPRP